MTYYDEPEFACEICGQDPGDCVCPVCPLCNVVGDPACYGRFGHLPKAAHPTATAERFDEIPFGDYSEALEHHFSRKGL